MQMQMAIVDMQPGRSAHRATMAHKWGIITVNPQQQWLYFHMLLCIEMSNNEINVDVLVLTDWLCDVWWAFSNVLSPIYFQRATGNERAPNNGNGSS